VNDSPVSRMHENIALACTYKVCQCQESEEEVEKESLSGRKRELNWLTLYDSLVSLKKVFKCWKLSLHQRQITSGQFREQSSVLQQEERERCNHYLGFHSCIFMCILRSCIKMAVWRNWDVQDLQKIHNKQTVLLICFHTPCLAEYVRYYTFLQNKRDHKICMLFFYFI